MKISEVSVMFLSIVLTLSLLSAIIYPYSHNYDKQVFVGLRIVSAVLGAVVDMKPEALNLRSRGKWITAYIELREGYDVANINVSTTMLNDTIPVELKPTAIGDYDSDGIPDLMVKFNRQPVINYILSNIDLDKLYEERFMTVTLTITGYLNDGTPFQGSTAIRIIMPMPRGLYRIFPI